MSNSTTAARCNECRRALGGDGERVALTAAGHEIVWLCDFCLERERLRASGYTHSHELAYGDAPDPGVADAECVLCGSRRGIVPGTFVGERERICVRCFTCEGCGLTWDICECEDRA